MLANGSSLDTVDRLPLTDAQDLYHTLRNGLWGPYGTFYQNYNTYLSAHLNKEVAVAVASGKKYKATEPLKFHELYPVADDFLTLGLGKVVREVKTKDDLGKRALLAIPTEGAPAWLIETMKD
jgi:hypothetical protein